MLILNLSGRNLKRECGDGAGGRLTPSPPDPVLSGIGSEQCRLGQTRDPILPRSSKPPHARSLQNYWFDPRHIEQFDVSVQSFRTLEGKVLTLLRALDLRMTEIFG